MRLLKILILEVMVLGCCGCSILKHMDQLSMMGEFSREKDAQHKIVNQSDAAYEGLLAAINTGKIKDYPNEKAIIHNFGEPIENRSVDSDGKKEERWLYRNAIPQKAKEKLYLYFDDQGQLTHYNLEKIEW